MKKLSIGYLLFTLLLASSFFTLAAYTSLSSAKRVITVKGAEQYFTSDVLLAYEKSSSTLQTRTYSFGADTQDYTFTVQVCNHLQNDETKFDMKGFQYTFTAELLDDAGNAVTDEEILSSLTIMQKETITKTVTENGVETTKTESKEPTVIRKDNGTQYTITSSFAGGQEKAETKTYTFSWKNKDILKYKIKITAVPDSKTTSYKPLGRVIVMATDTTQTAWKGSFLSTEENAVNSKQKLGLLNYRISGHLEDDYILSWDSSKVEIDQWFLQDMNQKGCIIETETTGEGESAQTTAKITEDEQTHTKSVKLHLGAAGTPQQYTIQFYRTYAANDLNEEWETIKEYINFKAVENNAQSTTSTTEG